MAEIQGSGEFTANWAHYPENQIDLAITNTANVSSTNIGGQILYNINVTNLGFGTARDVQVFDPIPPGVSIISAYPPRSSDSWSIGEIPPGDHVTMSLLVKTNALGNITNSAEVSSSSTSDDPNTYNNHAKATTTVLGSLT